MNKIALTIFAAATTFALPAHAESQKESFKHDGSSYTYTVTDLGEAKLIRGTTEDGTPFRLIVRETSVRGTYNGNRVSFDRAEVKPLEIAAR